MVVLKSRDKALRDGDHIHGVIRASGINGDGKTNGLTAPSAASQADLLARVHQRAGITPDDLVEIIKRYESMGVDQVMTWVQFGGLPHEKIMESLRLIGEQVLPKVSSTVSTTA